MSIYSLLLSKITLTNEKIKVLIAISTLIFSNISLAILPGYFVFAPEDCPSDLSTGTFIGFGSPTGNPNDNAVRDANGNILVFGVLDPTSNIEIYECSSSTDSGSVTANIVQTTRTTTNLISQHLMSTITNAFLTGVTAKGFKGNEDEEDTEIQFGASSDKTPSDMVSFWGKTSITQITEEDGKNLRGYDSDIYQFVGGFDKKLGNVFFGTALTYAYSENELFDVAQIDSHTVGVTPYAAYKINDFLFVSGLAGYNYTSSNDSRSTKNPLVFNGNHDSDTHNYITEGNINFFKVIDSFIIKARGGVRYMHTNSSIKNSYKGRDTTFDELTWIGDIEIGYKLNMGLNLYSGLLYEYFDREASGASVRVFDSIAFMRYGVDYPINRSFTLGASIQHDLNDEDNDYITGGINARIQF